MPANKKITPTETVVNDNLPVLYVDDVNLRSRKDGLSYIVFTTSLPERDLEQVRLMIDKEHLENIIDNLCHLADYFPEPNDDDDGDDDDDDDDDDD